MTEREDIALELARDISRELYDRFVMGGWEPQDAHEQVAALLRLHVWAWIPVGERLPEFEEPVWGLLPFEDGKGYALAIVMRGDGEDGWLWHICDEGRMIEWPPTLKLAFECDDDYRVKYWMPLAALPSAPLSLESNLLERET